MCQNDYCARKKSRNVVRYAGLESPRDVSNYAMIFIRDAQGTLTIEVGHLF